MKANSWNVIASIPMTIFYNKVRSSALFFNGALHWVVDNKILTLNLSTHHVFTMNLFPQQYMWKLWGEIRLAVIKGSLAVILVHGGVGIWVRKEYKNDASWYKLPKSKEYFESYNPET